MIPAVVECCAGIDVGKKFVVVCVLKGPANGDAQASDPAPVNPVWSAGT